MVDIPENASFSGADIKAVVYMPINIQAINNQIKELNEEWDAIVSVSGERGDVYDINYGNVAIIEKAQYIWDRRAMLQELAANAQRGVSALTLAELSTLSYSIHRETFPVRSLGSVYAKDYTRGPRTIAGSLIFTVFNRHVLTTLLEASGAIVSTGIMEQPDTFNPNSPVLPDQIPPFDIVLKYANELGEESGMIIYGVQIVNEGQVTSVNDMITENQMQFVARDIDIMRDVSTRALVRNIGVRQDRTPRDLSQSDDIYQRLRRRRNPFI